jgi:predicted cupin superfamily sugar epimerase
MDLTAEHYISQLQLQPHPEGGFYKETYRAAQLIHVPGFEGERNVSTAIYFLLVGNHKSHFHKIKSDELWFYHDGAALEIFVLGTEGLYTIVLGKNIAAGEVLQATIPAHTWFASKVQHNDGFVLVSCTVAPGFSFEDFEMANKKELLLHYPDASICIELMCL